MQDVYKSVEHSFFTDKANSTLHFDSRMNFSLSLRKQKLSNQLMQKREINKPIPKNSNLIEIHTLDLSSHVEQIDLYNSITDPSKQIQFLIETIIKESNQREITEKNILFYSINETTYPTKDIIKFCLAKFISFLENTDLNENTKLVFPDEFVAVLIYESWISNDIRVRQCCLDILNEYSYNSEHLSEYVNQNTYAFGRFFAITYHADINIVETVIIVYTNVLIETTDAVIKKVSQKFPLYLRGIELLTADLSKFDTKMVIEFKLSMIDFISQAIRGCNDINAGRDSLLTEIKNYFDANITRNQNYLVRLLDLIQKLSMYEEMNREIVKNGLGFHLYTALKENINEVDILEQLLRIFTNLLYLDENTQHYFNMGIIFVLNKILNSYKNSILAKEHIIIKCCIYCLTTFTDGNNDYMKMLLDLNIPKTIMQISKIKNDNEIYYEAMEFFYGFLLNGNDNLVMILFSSVSLLEIFCKGLNLSGKDDFILLCLKCILILFKRNNKIYSTIRNLKIEFYGCCGAKNIERLLTHKNQEICDRASKIQEYIENNNPHQDGMNNYNKIII